jgi:SOS-response transcriptional repressor LexA
MGMTEAGVQQRDTRALGRYLAELRRAAQMTQTELGDRIGMSQVQVSHWEKGDIKEVTVERLEQFARALRADRDELARLSGLAVGTNVPYNADRGEGTGRRAESPTAYDTLRDAFAQMPFPIPVLPNTRALTAKGRGGYMAVEEYLWMPASYLARRASLVGVRVVGESMAPTLMHGDHVAVDRDATFAVGNIIAAVVDDDFVVKRVKRVGQHSILLEGDNDGAQVLLSDQSVIVGKVINVVRNLE